MARDRGAERREEKGANIRVEAAKTISQPESDVNAWYQSDPRKIDRVRGFGMGNRSLPVRFKAGLLTVEIGKD